MSKTTKEIIEESEKFADTLCEISDDPYSTIEWMQHWNKKFYSQEEYDNKLFTIDSLETSCGKLININVLEQLRKELKDKLFECNFIISDYSSKLETNTDPIVLGLTIIGKFRDILL